MEKVDKCKTKWIISKRSCKKESNGNARNKKHSKKKTICSTDMTQPKKESLNMKIIFID